MRLTLKPVAKPFCGLAHQSVANWLDCRDLHDDPTTHLFSMDQQRFFTAGGTLRCLLVHYLCAMPGEFVFAHGTASQHQVIKPIISLKRFSKLMSAIHQLTR